jgi:hypothetical protein
VLLRYFVSRRKLVVPRKSGQLSNVAGSVIEYVRPRVPRCYFVEFSVVWQALHRASSVLKTGKSESSHSASRGALAVVVGHERIIRSVESAALEASLAQMPNIEGSMNEMEANQMWWSETRAFRAIATASGDDVT